MRLTTSAGHVCMSTCYACYACYMNSWLNRIDLDSNRKHTKIHHRNFVDLVNILKLKDLSQKGNLKRLPLQEGLLGFQFANHLGASSFA